LQPNAAQQPTAAHSGRVTGHPEVVMLMLSRLPSSSYAGPHLKAPSEAMSRASQFSEPVIYRVQIRIYLI